MVDLISNVLTSINTNNVTPLLNNAEKILGGRQLRIVLINIIDWLKLEYKREIQGKPSKPLQLVAKYDWCNNIKTLVESDDIFAKTFSINENGLYYNKNLDNKTLSETRKISYEGYRPPEFLTGKKE
ncbi:hypothetical protein SAMN02745163_03219 [Clostridium cavendishii DSM 21758]|uniref:Uncharacterized protein n=1 Tax=Clostridium cavendishii DSM 21758 TaxID=1121302 RepID=A0A1M6PP89_9CLOT|nr:hypothetical protein [Clostridium cavendishii]SHK09824.1 hypothetical protein SAMN02745163_03219 [Clostridium cavendishii DSM 21758]